jgi:hypothetical protein
LTITLIKLFVLILQNFYKEFRRICNFITIICEILIYTNDRGIWSVY